MKKLACICFYLFIYFNVFIVPVNESTLSLALDRGFIIQRRPRTDNNSMNGGKKM